MDRCLAEKVNGTKPLTRWACGRIAQYRWRVRLELKLADLWLGVYWIPDPVPSGTVYVCVVPCLPLHVDWWKKWPRATSDDQAKDAERDVSDKRLVDSVVGWPTCGCQLDRPAKGECWCTD